ncbi:MAG TPA: HWE histidine kinase domain-containing protein [Rhizomicrobium sp.]|jgi:two-component sensor histidine kinase
MPTSHLVAAMNEELAAAGHGLVGNGDLLRGVLAGCGDCIKILDLDGRLQFMSEGGKRVMEVEDFEALKGCPWPDFWAGEGNLQAIAALEEARAGRTARFRNAANTAKGTPRFWDVQVSPIFGSDGKPSHFLSISRDITDESKALQVLRENTERQQFLTQELTHRVKNTLTTVIALANQTFRGEVHREARAVYISRIKTLSDAYNVLTESSWSHGLVGHIVESALAPYRAGEDRFSIRGPDYAVKPNQALTLALALNELATNSMKYGSLSVPDGRVDIVWSADTECVFQFEWREAGGPPVTAPTQSGFGSRVIKSLLAEDFRGHVEHLFEPGGVICVLRVPKDVAIAN